MAVQTLPVCGSGASRYRALVNWLRYNSRMPMVAMELVAVLVERVSDASGEVAATRDDLAAEVGTTPAEVSRIMGELHALGAVERRSVKVKGMRGPGRAVYFVTDVMLSLDSLPEGATGGSAGRHLAVFGSAEKTSPDTASLGGAALERALSAEAEASRLRSELQRRETELQAVRRAAARLDARRELA